MPTTPVEGSATALGRRALVIASALALAGSGLGLIGIRQGTVAGLEIPLILSCVLYTAGTLAVLLAGRTTDVQNVATVSTVYFGTYLCAGAIIAIDGSGDHLSLLVYLAWFFPLLVFNKLVNAPVAARLLSKTLRAAPLLVVAACSPQLLAEFSPKQILVVAATGMSYIFFGAMLDIVSRYREEYLVERARALALKVESEVLESISDCFISLDTGLRLLYLNDAACVEFNVTRDTALNVAAASAVPAFFSASMLAHLRTASGNASASTFEAQDEKFQWYELRCFPRPDGTSVFFRNITQAMVSRRKLDDAQDRLREHAELLDMAQDAIYVQDMDGRVIYWNKGAERVYGWTSAEVTGRLIGDVFPAAAEYLHEGAAAALRAGEWDGEVSQCRRDGSGLIVESRCTLVRAANGTPRSILAINTDITNRKAAEAKITRLAFFDVLTDLPNRVLLRERLETAVVRATRQSSTGVLFFIDLDDFKTLNDTLGHDVGDVLLQEVALRLTSCVRDNATVARLGGDEFVVMVEGLVDDASAAAAQSTKLGNTLLAAFLTPYQVGAHEYTITASIGIALFSGLSATADDLLKRADLAMYRAKAAGRNTMCVFDPAMQTLVSSRAALLSDLRRALQNHEFELHYQPQVDQNGCVMSAEALLRWPHPRRGMVPPNEFIPLAEEAGLIVELGRWVLETACAQLAAWAANPRTERLSVAVNVSVRQFLDSDFVSLVREVLDATGANPHRLKLEITESTMMEKVDETIAKMTALKAYFVGFSLDDFGTGYSSLSHLKRLPLDQLKIDQSFVRDVLTDSKDASIARTIITLGQNLNLFVIAEGVETQAQRDFLEHEGCYAYQGYFFSKALNVAQFEAFVAQTPLPQKTVHQVRKIA